jgi:hypothetical protein
MEVIIMMKVEKIYNKIYDLLNEKLNCYFEAYYHGCFEDIHIYVEINDGDWKHDHAYLRNLIYEAFDGKYEYEEQLIGESDSDCYSAKHIFKFNENDIDL